MPYKEQSEYVPLPECVDEIARVYFPGLRYKAAADLEQALKDGALKAALERSKREIDAWEWTQGHQNVYSSNLVIRRAALLKYYKDLWKAPLTEPAPTQPAPSAVAPTQPKAAKRHSKKALMTWWERECDEYGHLPSRPREDQLQAAKQVVGPTVTAGHIKELRRGLPDDHPWRKPGRRHD